MIEKKSFGKLSPMSTPHSFISRQCVIFVAIGVSAFGMDIVPGGNNQPISQVVYDVGGSELVQIYEVSGVEDVGNTPVLLKSVNAGGKTLSYFNLGQTKVLNANPQLGLTTGVGVVNNNTVVLSNSDFTAYVDAVAATSMDTNLRHYGFHDFLSLPITDPNAADYDLHFSKAFAEGDSFLVSERWGNSTIQLMALGSDGAPYAGANLISLGGLINPAVGYDAYDWTTGFASSANVPSQAQALTLFSAQKFFDGTSNAYQPVYGLRIFNQTEADLKILGISDDTFADNLDNLQVPEPSTWCAIISCTMGALLRRKRR